MGERDRKERGDAEEKSAKNTSKGLQSRDAFLGDDGKEDPNRK